MMEQEWLACDDPQQMLEYFSSQASKRKLRLFAVACCRRIWAEADSDCHRLSELTERYADEPVDEATLQAARRAARDPDWAVGDAFGLASVEDIKANAVHVTANAASAAADVATDDMDTVAEAFISLTPEYAAARQAEHAAQANLFREVFGNPFRRVTIAPAWLTSTVVSLATAIYDERAFDRLPILADALEDAGCTNVDILNHCRQPGEHVRGCWVVDLVLGKS